VKPGILIIDDSLTVRMDLAEAFASAGFAPTACATGAAGREAVQKTAFALIVLDVLLPDADGIELLAAFKNDPATAAIPVMLLATEAEVRDRVRGLRRGADEYVGKPYDPVYVLARARELVRARPEPRDGASSTPPTVLAIDDSATYLEALAFQIRNEGYDVVFARSGQEALELLAVQRVEGILLDLVMPGLSGQETCRRIKATPACRDIPLIMLTALEEQEAMIESINAGADDYITKSADFEVLKARLRAQLRRKHFEDEHRRMREELLHKEMEAAEGRAARELADIRAALLADLERKNEELESFSYAVAHDLRAPLRAIHGFSQLLVEEHASALDADGKRLLRVVRDNVRQMGRLIDDLLALSRLGRQELERVPVDMAALARSVAEELQRVEPRGTVSVRIGDLPCTSGDRGMLQQVFVNLIGNAFKFSQRVSHPTVEIGCMERSEPTYFVSDNGAGFDARFADKLFKVFQRLHRAEEFEGTGVGLAIVQRIVQRHGGRVWAEGAVDRGATFYFTLPAEGGAAHESDGSRDPAGRGQPGGRGARAQGAPEAEPG